MQAPVLIGAGISANGWLATSGRNKTIDCHKAQVHEARKRKAR